MMKQLITPALIALCVTISAAGGACATDGAALLKKADEIRAPGSDFTFRLALQSASGRTEQLEVAIKDATKGLVRYTQPAGMAGRAILFVDQNMWVYVPGTRRALRISPQQRVLGGVSSADVARTVYSIDYKVVDAAMEGDHTVLHLAPATKSAAYGGIELTVISSSGAPRQAVFLAGGGGRKLKTMYFEAYRDVLGAMRPTQLRVIDHLQGDSATIMLYSDFEKTETPASWFQPGNLSRL